MNNRLYVDNFAATTTENELKAMFSLHGNVVEIHLAVGRVDGRRRNFGFVTMATPEGARAAIEALDGKEMGSRSLTVARGHAAVLAREHASGSRERLN